MESYAFLSPLAALSAKLQRDREVSRTEFGALPGPSEGSQITQVRQVTVDDLDREEARLEEDYNKRWLTYEGTIGTVDKIFDVHSILDNGVSDTCLAFEKGVVK